MKTIALTQGKFALVDDADFARLSAFKWSLSRCGDFQYASRYAGGGRKARRTVRMHVEIAQPPKGMHVDHLNHDTLDNRRANLRVCTRAENNANKIKAAKHNKLGVLGVRKVPSGKFQATVTIKGDIRYLGTFDTAEKASAAYWTARRNKHA